MIAYWKYAAFQKLPLQSIITLHVVVIKRQCLFKMSSLFFTPQDCCRIFQRYKQQSCLPGKLFQSQIMSCKTHEIEYGFLLEIQSIGLLSSDYGYKESLQRLQHCVTSQHVQDSGINLLVFAQLPITGGKSSSYLCLSGNCLNQKISTYFS